MGFEVTHLKGMGFKLLRWIQTLILRRSCSSTEIQGYWQLKLIKSFTKLKFYCLLKPNI